MQVLIFQGTWLLESSLHWHNLTNFQQGIMYSDKYLYFEQ